MKTSAARLLLMKFVGLAAKEVFRMDGAPHMHEIGNGKTAWELQLLWEPMEHRKA
jgi:hypothetical protein